jgi:hypothetical protein
MVFSEKKRRIPEVTSDEYRAASVGKPPPSPPPPGFSQVFILKGVKVVCFDTVLQVLILNVVSASEEGAVATGQAKFGKDVTPISRVFAYEWQTKGLRDRECVRVPGKGLTDGLFCVSAHDGRDL